MALELKSRPLSGEHCMCLNVLRFNPFSAYLNNRETVRLDRCLYIQPTPLRPRKSVISYETSLSIIRIFRENPARLRQLTSRASLGPSLHIQRSGLVARLVIWRMSATFSEALFFGRSFMVAVRRAPSWRAGFQMHRSTNLRTAATYSFSRDTWQLLYMHLELTMKKIVPDPPAIPVLDTAQYETSLLDRAAADRALDYYLPGPKPARPVAAATYEIPDSVNLETALAQASDLLRCAGASANEVGNGMPGAARDLVLSIGHLVELAKAYVDKSLDGLTTH